MSKYIDLTGQKFGKLTVIKRLENDKYKRAIWFCKCDCGNTKIVSSGNLRSGKVASCGCIKGKYQRKPTNFYEVKNDIVELKIKSNKYGEIIFFIDKDNYQKVQNHHWTLRKLDNKFYAYANSWKDKSVALHRYLTNCPDNLVVDHINRNTLDNRKVNLRVCNSLVNIKNRPSNKTGYQGIVINEYGQYRVRLQINKIKYDKTFKDLNSAIEYRKELEEKYHRKEEICLT